MSEKDNLLLENDIGIAIAELLGTIILSFLAQRYLEKEYAWVVIIITSFLLVLKASLYYSIKHILLKQKSLLVKIDEDIKLEEVMKSYNSIHPELKPYAETLLRKFKQNIEDVFVKDKRTGKLEIFDYYETLYKNIKNGIKNGGRIWACSTLLNNEWDPADRYEQDLMTLFIKADQNNVHTDRIFVFKNDKLLNPEGPVPPGNIPDEKFLEGFKEYVTIKNLLPYMIDKSIGHLYHYPNTSSYVIDKRVYEVNRDYLRDGFCAFEFGGKNKRNVFIRDTSIDKVDDKELCGEILFDQEKINDIKEKFSVLIGAVSKMSLRDYVLRNCNENARKFLEQNGVVTSIATVGNLSPLEH